MAIDLGNIVPIAGKTVGTGIASGLDTEALVESLSAARQAPLDQLEDDLELNADKLSAFNELTTILDALQNATDFLRDAPGVGNDSENIFNFLKTSLSSTTLSSVESYLTLDADPGSLTGNLDIAIGNVAKALSQITDSFTSKTTSITEAAGGGTSGLFSAGTFQIASNVATPITLSSSGTDSLVTSEYGIIGTAGTSVLTATGVHNFATTNGDPTLLGSIEDISGSFSSAPESSLILSFTKEGRTYTSQAFATDAGGGSNAIEANQNIVFSNSDTGTSFRIQTGAEYIIDDDVNNINSFIAGIEADLASQSFYQSRELSNFQESKIQSTLSGLSSSNVKLTSDGFTNYGDHGKISGFTVNAPSISGANDSSISVDIDGETYQVTGLGQPSVIGISTDLTAANFASNGSDLGTTFAGGYSNFVTSNADTNLIGTPTAFSATFTDNGGFPTNTVSFSVDINGSTYTASDVAIDAGTDQLATGALTFTNAAGDSSFDITITDNTLLTITDGTSATAAADLITADFADYEITQSRELSNFDATLAAGTSLDGLARSNILLTRDDFSTTAVESGALGQFSITHVGADDNTLSVSINGETYEATGLADSLSTNITLTSTTDTGNTLTINLADAGVAALDLSSQPSANLIADDLNLAFRTTDTINGNLTLVNQTDNNKTLSINLADAGVYLNLEDATDDSLLTAALNNAFGTGKLADITIEEGDSLQEIAANINASSKASGVSASILQISANDFRLQLSSDKVGLDNAYQIIDKNTVVGDVSLNTQQAAENSVVSVNGLVLNRSSNSISDVIDGLTINVKQETTAFSNQGTFDGLGAVDSISASITPDTTVAESGIVNFINAYNDFRIFSTAQGLRDGQTGKFVDEAVLGDESVLQNLIRQVSTELNGVVAGATDSDFSSLASIGVVFTDFAGDDETNATSNLLTYDPDTLQKALVDNFENIREIFEYTFTASSTNLSIFERANSTSLTDYKVDVDTSREAGNKVRILDLDDNFLFNADLSGSQINGQAGTTLEGLKLIYSGDGSDVITVHASQGIADRIFNVLEPLTEDGGALENAVEFVKDSNDRLNTEKIDLQGSIDTYRQQLLGQFSALESAISVVNTLLNFLDAQSESLNS